MRYRLYFRIEKPLVLNINYHEKLQQFIYLLLLKEDKEYSTWLHDKGFDEKFKLFTFSRIFSKNKKIENDTITFEDYFCFEVSSIDHHFDKLFLQSLNKNKKYVFNERTIYLHQYKVFLFNDSENIKIHFISPICLKKSYISMDNKHKTYYLNPLDSNFIKSINSNFRNKYYAYYGKYPVEDIEIEVIKVDMNDKCVTSYKGIYITSWYGIYRLKGKTEYLEFLYYVGLGDHNSQGFGMFAIKE